ncbi:hypothetical protein, partial [Listeria monocytogenes]|uniref:hypothetical protein n=1 Tax=Listeria monocytogenes TaxID=1639 RepID=UPI002FDC2A1B
SINTTLFFKLLYGLKADGIFISNCYFYGLQAVLSGGLFGCENEVFVTLHNSSIIGCKTLSKDGGVNLLNIY